MLIRINLLLAMVTLCTFSERLADGWTLSAISRDFEMSCHSAELPPAVRRPEA